MKTNGAEVLNYLLPNGGWVITGEDFDSIIYDKDVKPINKDTFDKALNEINIIIENKKIDAINKKSDLLNKLGITEDEARLLLS